MITKRLASLLCGAALTGVVLTNALPAAADQAPGSNGPSVARVSVVEGSTVVQRGDEKTQTTAVVNAALLPGDYISTGSTSRAELQFDGETAVRLGGNVQARITNDDANRRRLQLADGTVEIGIVHADRPFQVDTPSVSVRAQDSGDYRITIGRDGSTWVTARRGQATVVTPQRTYDLGSGRTLVARGSASDPAISYTTEVGYDSFDDFNAKRDQTMVAALNASPNLSPSIAGYDNLDQYGNWQNVAGYGQVWVPDEPSGWAPYRDGSWAWEGGYGWTWVGSEPWGWAPYHYGRWFWANGYGWAWYPPAYSYYPPAWYPALVGFYGFGGGFGLSVGFPYVGWCPLAPFEPFYAWYPGWFWGGGFWGYHPWGYGFGGFGTRIVNITNITNIYRNFRHGGGSGTLRGNFGHGTIGRAMPVTSKNLGGRAGTIRGAVPVNHDRGTLGFGKAPSSHVAFSRDFDSRFGSHGTLARTQRSAGTGTMHGTAISRNESGRSDPWQRFDQSRGTMHGTEAGRYSGTGRTSSFSQATRGGSRPGDSWSRFSNERGTAKTPAYSRGAYDRAYSRGLYDERSYSRNPYSSYSRGSYPSYSRGSYPSYSRGASPSYSRGGSNGGSHPSGGGSHPPSGGGNHGGRPPR